MQRYKIDIVLCVDTTNGMQPFIQKLQTAAQCFYEQVKKAYEVEGKELSSLRVKFIMFKDFLASEADPMKESKFFTLPAENEVFAEFVNSIEARGCEDAPVCALEAVTLALKSDWTKASDSLYRQYIFVCTDGVVQPLQAGASDPRYPQGMPKDLDELAARWEGTDQYFESSYSPKAGRLVVFASSAKPWIEMKGWNRYWFDPIEQGNGLQEIEISHVIDIMAGEL